MEFFFVISLCFALSMIVYYRHNKKGGCHEKNFCCLLLVCSVSAFALSQTFPAEIFDTQYCDEHQSEGCMD